MSSKFLSLRALLEKAVGRLARALDQPKDEYIRDSAIQRFEFTFELVWKTLKAYLGDQGVQVYSPRDSLREAFRAGLIDDDPVWLKTVELRNLTSHTYHEPTADTIYEMLPSVLIVYRALLGRLKQVP
jgi:nucleotidyltransferase substrate binding protein (TIGR01987 family)